MNAIAEVSRQPRNDGRRLFHSIVADPNALPVVILIDDAARTFDKFFFGE
jgi:hypothetical protein